MLPLTVSESPGLQQQDGAEHRLGIDFPGPNLRVANPLRLQVLLVEAAVADGVPASCSGWGVWRDLDPGAGVGHRLLPHLLHAWFDHRHLVVVLR